MYSTFPVLIDLPMNNQNALTTLEKERLNERKLNSGIVLLLATIEFLLIKIQELFFTIRINKC